MTTEGPPTKMQQDNYFTLEIALLRWKQKSGRRKRERSKGEGVRKGEVGVFWVRHG